MPLFLSLGLFGALDSEVKLTNFMTLNYPGTTATYGSRINNKGDLAGYHDESLNHRYIHEGKASPMTTLGSHQTLMGFVL
jgi:hypothetical protein